VLSLPPSVRLFVATQPVDGRKGADSLMVIVRDVFKQDPLSGHLFIFFSKRCDRVRVVYWDRNGYATWTKRLEAGRFRPTFSPDGRLSSVAIEAAELG
jgi:transposase